MRCRIILTILSFLYFVLLNRCYQTFETVELAIWERERKEKGVHESMASQLTIVIVTPGAWSRISMEWRHLHVFTYRPRLAIQRQIEAYSEVCLSFAFLSLFGVVRVNMSMGIWPVDWMILVDCKTFRTERQNTRRGRKCFWPLWFVCDRRKSPPNPPTTSITTIPSLSCALCVQMFSSRDPCDAALALRTDHYSLTNPGHHSFRLALCCN